MDRNNIGQCLRLKMRVALYSAVGAALLVLLYTVSQQTATLGGGYDRRLRRAVHLESPRVFSEAQLTQFLQLLQTSHLVELRNSDLGSWAARQGLNKVGTLSGGGGRVLMKERRRYNMQAELFSYYLNCYLDLWNAPPTALRCIHKQGDESVLAGEYVGETANSAVERNRTTCFIVTEYVEGIQDKVYMPSRDISLETVSRSPTELNHLLQWSDLILFDYLTGHTDRLLDSNFQLLPQLDLIVPLTNVANLAKSSAGELLLIDHEATFHSSYAKATPNSLQRRRQLYYLGIVFVYRRHTVERVCELCTQSDPAGVLEEYIGKHDRVSLEIASRLAPEDRAEFRERLKHVCSNTCHLLQHKTQVL